MQREFNFWSIFRSWSRLISPAVLRVWLSSVGTATCLYVNSKKYSAWPKTSKHTQSKTKTSRWKLNRWQRPSTDFASCATPSSTSLSLLLTCAPPWAFPFCVCVVSGVPESDQKHTGWQQLHNQILSPAKCAGAKPNLSTCAAFQHSAFVAGFPTFILFYVFFTVSRYAANKPPFPLHTNPPNPAPIYPDSTSIDFI